MIKRLLWLSATLIILMSSGPVRAETITVAVASNFTAPAEELAKAFEESTGHNVRLTFGSSGKLLAQITHGSALACPKGNRVIREADSHKSRFITQGVLR